ncbi:sigma-70 family RNA polymerase sigma factor [Inquilinus limosus]|uniref:sigma-70 family RNA polymerase sigma factor n=1 Tax=Inquilinus limosus TaxID=171674 RepID=UPI003F1413E6
MAEGEEALADADLLARIADGDRRAFAALMRRHGDRVRGLALAFGGRAAEADDIVQDVFLMLWRRPDAWTPGQAAFTTWLYRVVANRCLDQARRRRLRRWLPFAEAPEPADDAPGALAGLAGRDRLAAVARMIRTLPERQRLALLLAVQGGRSNAEIASILGVSEGAAEQLLVRARRTLRAMIEERETGP